MLTVGLVAEGTHDFIMLEPFIRYELSKRAINDVKFKLLQPYQDATGSMSDGGWPRVVAWCKANSGAALQTFFTPLFAGDPECDAIIVHLDGDALELIAQHTTIAVPQPITDITTRVDLLFAALEAFIDPPLNCRRKIG